MEEVSPSQSGQQLFLDIGTRLREIEERQQLLKDRIMLIGKSVIDVRERVLEEMRETRKSIDILQKDNINLKETLQLMSEKLNSSAKQEEINIIKRQLDMIRSVNN